MLSPGQRPSLPRRRFRPLAYRYRDSLGSTRGQPRPCGWAAPLRARTLAHRQAGARSRQCARDWRAAGWLGLVTSLAALRFVLIADSTMRNMHANYTSYF